MTHFSIGSLRLASPVLLAPMAGVTDRPFRRMVRRFGAGLVYSEMIASNQMVRAHRETVRMSTPCHDEAPMAVQLAGNDPQLMAEAARMNVDRGAVLIDINMGCPVKKVVSGQLAGSALMRDEALAGRIMEAVAQAVPVPVTVKMRLGWDETSLTAPSLARVAWNSGMAAVTVHGRTRAQLYRGEANWQAIRAVREAMPLPLVVNGDICSIETARAALEASGADAVMIGRGCQGRPWLLQQVACALQGLPALPEPSVDARCQLLLEHYQEILSCYGEYTGLRIARKHVAWATYGLPGAAAFREKFNILTDVRQALSEITAFFSPLVKRQAVL